MANIREHRVQLLSERFQPLETAVPGPSIEQLPKSGFTVATGLTLGGFTTMMGTALTAIGMTVSDRAYEWPPFAAMFAVGTGLFAVGLYLNQK
jgi:hypothetical protein